MTYKGLNLEEICKKTIEAVREVGAYVRTERMAGLKVEEKEVNSLVTQIDRASEAMLIERLTAIVSGTGILGEEGIANRESDGLNWIIDPIDGTTNFIHGMPCYSISVALSEGNELLAGIVYEISRNECFYAWKNGGAWLDGEKIRCSNNGELRNSLMATGFPYHDEGKMDIYLALFKDFVQNTRGIRRLGSAAVDLAYVANGRFDGFYEYNLNPWDVAGGALIVIEAGGKVSDFSGGENYLYGKELVASSSAIYKPFLETIQKYF